MRVVSVLSRKGGVGKTTCAMNLSAALSRANRVLMVDVDPQKSATDWAERAESSGEDLPFDFTSEADPSILQQLRKLEYDIIVVDTPGSHEKPEVLNAVMASSDFAILPLTAAYSDIKPMFETIRDFVVPANVPYRVLFNRVDSRRGEARLDEWKQAIDEGEFFTGQKGLPRFTNHIRMASKIEDMALEGKVVTQYRDSRKTQGAIHDYTMVSLELTSLWANAGAVA